MTPLTLWGLLIPGALAAVDTMVLAIAAFRAPRLWRSCAGGRPRPAIVLTICTAMVLYLSYLVIIGAGPIPVAPQGWERLPIEDGWQFYYALTMGALAVLWMQLLVVFAAAVVLAIGAYLAWLDLPSGSTSWGAITNRQRLRMLWRLRVHEHRIARMLTKTAGPHRRSVSGEKAATRVVRSVRTIEPGTIITEFHLNTRASGTAVLRAHPVCSPISPNRQGVGRSSRCSSRTSPPIQRPCHPPVRSGRGHDCTLSGTWQHSTNPRPPSTRLPPPVPGSGVCGPGALLSSPKAGDSAMDSRHGHTRTRSGHKRPLRHLPRDPKTTRQQGNSLLMRARTPKFGPRLSADSPPLKKER